jgi:putative transposase
MDMFAPVHCLRPHVTATTLRPLSRIAWAMLARPGRVTMLGLARWAGTGGRDRTVQRVCSQALPWAMLFWVFCRQHVPRPEEVYLLAGDAVVVTNAGKHTYGLERLFSSLSGKPIPGFACFAFSLGSGQARRAFPVRVEQVVRRAAEKAASKAKAAATPQKPSAPLRRPGRPQGSRSKPHAAVPLTPAWSRITAMLEALLKLSAGVLPLTYLVLDGHFGHPNARPMARQSRLHLLSKLRCDAAWSFPYTGPYAGRGPRRQYGSQVDDGHMPAKYLQETTVEGPLQTRVYQAPLLHTEVAQPVHVVIITKRNLRTHGRAHVILLSRDLTLAYAPLVDDYRWRFQIEFNCRDAKQYWRLEDVMNVTPTGGTKAANLSLFMVKVAYHRQAEVRQRDPDSSLLDLKAHCRGYTSVEETITMLPEKPAPVFLGEILHKGAGLGRIHATQPSCRFS